MALFGYKRLGYDLTASLSRLCDNVVKLYLELLFFFFFFCHLIVAGTYLHLGILTTQPFIISNDKCI